MIPLSGPKSGMLWKICPMPTAMTVIIASAPSEPTKEINAFVFIANSPAVGIRQHTSAYVSIRMYMEINAFVFIANSPAVSIRQQTSADVSRRQHTYVYVYERVCFHREQASCQKVSTRQHTSAYVSIRIYIYVYIYIYI